ncbi:hypothetical protein COHA_007526 [Chlorella ohadii]|uniref:Gamma carbonic anhydrase n=1 Tax=Chlorella ohadii TaxID=2649997 RepID=A0AAD5H3D9_9CHLO|nr:hypothetical protein COHA_007526 [Chlorella ohadii]
MARVAGSIARGLGKVFDGLGSSLGFGYRETLNKAQCVQAFAGKRPTLGNDVFVAPNASVIGDVKLGSGASVWYGAVIRGDVNSVTIGDKTSVQDNVLIHVAKHNAAGKALPTVIGSRVTIGPGATVHAATIEDCVVIGMGATIMDGAKVWAGSPAKFIRNLVEDEAAFVAESADTTAQLAALHAEENAKSFDEVEADKARRADRLERDPDYDEQQGVQRNFVTREIEKLADST